MYLLTDHYAVQSRVADSDRNLMRVTGGRGGGGIGGDGGKWWWWWWWWWWWTWGREKLALKS